MAGEIVEIVSSDDEFEESRRPIGWNYQGIAKNKLKSQTHGRPRPKLPRNSEDDVLIVELTPEKVPPSTASEVPFSKGNQNGYHSNGQKVSKSLREPLNSVGSGHGKHGPLPKIKSRHAMPNSCSRQEIKALTRNATQSTMSQFLKVVDNKRKQPDDDSTSHQEKKKIKLILINTDSTKAQNRTGKPFLKNDEKLFKSGQLIDTIKSSSGPSRNDEAVTAVTKMDSGANVPDFALRGSEDPPGTLEDDTSEKSKGALTSFIIRWKAIKASIDKNDRKIEDKIWKYYYLAHSSFTHSKKFLMNVELATSRMTLDNIYVLIKDLLDSLKSYKDVPYKEIKQRCVDGAGPSAEQPAEPLTEEEKKREKKLKKIERMMKKISEKIQELDEAEVDLDDEDNSAYLVQERLKAQFMKLDDFYCKLAQCSRSTGRPVERKFKYEGSRYSEINQRITAWINKHREFPDYQDVLNLVKKVTNDSLLPLRPETVRVQAQEIFRDVGRELKERREHDDLYSIYSYAAPDLPPDPATKDPDLAARLNNNAELAQDKLSKVFQKFVDKETEQREATDKKIASADETKVKTSSDDEPTEKESKDSEAPLKDSDETTRDSDDTDKDGEDLSNDTNNEDTLDGVEEPERDPVPLDRGDQPENHDVVKEDQLKNHDPKSPTRKSNDSPDVLPFHQEELVFQASALTTKNPAYDVDQLGHNDTEEPDDLVFDDGPRNRGDQKKEDEHDMYDHCDVEEQDSDAADVFEQIDGDDDGDEDEEISEVTTLPDIESKKFDDGVSNLSEDSAVERALDDHIEELMTQRSELELDDEEEEEDEDEEHQGNKHEVLEVTEELSEEASDAAPRSCVEKTHEHSIQIETATFVEDKVKDHASEFDSQCKVSVARTSIEIIEDEVDYAEPETSKDNPALKNAVKGTEEEEEDSYDTICEDNKMDCSEEDDTNLNKENRTPDKVTNSIVRFNTKSTIVDRQNISDNELNDENSLSPVRTAHHESATIERISLSPQKKEVSHLSGQDSISGLNMKSVKYSPSKPIQTSTAHDSSPRHHSPSGRLSSPATKRKLVSQDTSSENLICQPAKLAHQDHRVVPNRLSPQKQSVAPNYIESDKSVIHLRSPDRGTTTITRISLSPSNRQPNDLPPRVDSAVEEVISEDDDIQCLPSPDQVASRSPSKTGSVVTSLVRVNVRRGKLSVSRGIAKDDSPPLSSGNQTSLTSHYQSPSLPRYKNSPQAQQPSPPVAGYASPPPAGHRSPSAAGYGSPPLVKHQSPSAAGYGSPPVRNKSPLTAGYGSPPPARHQSPSAVGYGSPTPAGHRSPPLARHQSPSAVAAVGSPSPVRHESPAMAEVASLPPSEHRSPYAGYRSPPPARHLSPPDKSARLIIIGSPTKTSLEGQRGSRDNHSAPASYGRSTDRSPPYASPCKLSPKGPPRAAVAGSPRAAFSLTPDKALNAKSCEQDDVPEVLPSDHDSSEEDVQLADSPSDDEGSVTFFRAVTTSGGPGRASKRPHPAAILLPSLPALRSTVTCTPVIAGDVNPRGDEGRQSPDARFNGGHYRRYDGSSSPELVELE